MSIKIKEEDYDDEEKFVFKFLENLIAMNEKQKFS